MSLPSRIVDAITRTAAKVSSRGELITRPLEYSDPYYERVTTVATATLVIPAKTQKRFVITDIMIVTDKIFASATAGELIELYEAKPHDLATNTKTIFKLELLKNDRMIAVGLNLITSNTVALVAIVDDVNVDITIAGYYVDN